MKLDVSSLTECASRTASPKSPPFGSRAIVTFPLVPRTTRPGPRKTSSKKTRRDQLQACSDRFGTSPGPAYRWVAVGPESRALAVARVLP
jgi:hypothetical protein